MAKLGNLYVSLIADTAAFSSGLSKARSDVNSTSASINRSLASIDKGFQGLGRGVQGFAGELFSLKGAVGALVGVGAGAGLVAVARQALETVGGLGELASQIGVTTDLLQVLTYAGTQYGVSADEIQGSLSKLTATIGAAAEGGKSQIEMFDRLGIKILDTGGKVRSTDAIFRELVQAISLIPDPATRAALAKEAMGKAAQRMMPLIEGGTAALDDMTRKARELGLVFSSETIAKADEAADHLATVSKVLGTQFQGMLVDLAPLLTAVADKMATVAKAIRDIYDAAGRGRQKGQLLDEMQTAEATLRAYEGEKKRIETMFAQSGPGWFYTQDDYNADIARLNKQIADATQKVAAARAAFAQATGAQGGDINERFKRGRTIIPEASSSTNPTPPNTGKSEAAKEVDAAIKKLQQLQQQVAEIGKSGFDLEFAKALEGLNLQNPGVAALVEQFRAAAKAIQADKDATDELDAAWKRAEASMQEWNKTQEEGRQVAVSVRTPLEALADQLGNLQRLYQNGAISLKTYNLASEQARKAAEDAAEGTESYRSAMADLGATFGSAFEEAALGMDEASSAAEAMGNALQGLLKDIERIILRLAVTDPIAEGLTGLLKGINWASIFGGASWGTPSAGGGFSQAQFGGSGPSSGGGWFSDLFSWLGFHGGGIAGGRPTFSRRMPMAAFAGAPRLHGGGFIGPGEVPAILKRGEGVFTAEQMANMAPAGSGGGTVVNIIDQRGSGQVEQRESTGPNGQKQIDILIKDSVERTLGRGGFDKSFGANYGLKRKPGKSS